MERCVTLILENAPDSKTPEEKALLAAVKRVSGATSIAHFHLEQPIVLLAPVDDIATLAAKIDFGTVKATDLANREITIAVGPASPPN